MGTSPSELKYSTVTRITGKDETAAVETHKICGKDSLCVSATDVANELLTGSKDVSGTPIKLCSGSDNLINRKGLFIQNVGGSCLHVGDLNVSSLNGLQVCGNGSGVFLKVSDTANIYGVCASSETTRVIIAEVK